MFVHVAQAVGCNVIAVVKRDSQIESARKMGAHDVVHIGSVGNPVEAVRALSPGGRGSDHDRRGCAVGNRDRRMVTARLRRPKHEWSPMVAAVGATVSTLMLCVLLVELPAASVATAVSVSAPWPKALMAAAVST